MEQEVTPLENKKRLPVLAIVMIVFSAIFGLFTLVAFAFESFISWACIDVYYNGENSLGQALGAIILFVYSILVGIVTVVGGVVSLPFNIILLKKVGRKWYSLMFIIATAALIVFALLAMFIFPITSGINPASPNSSSSIPSSSI